MEEGKNSQFKLRIQPELKRKTEESAQLNGRSINSEVNYQLARVLASSLIYVDLAQPAKLAISACDSFFRVLARRNLSPGVSIDCPLVG